MSLQVQTLPMQEDTSALIQVFPETEKNGTIRFLNGTGSVINDRTFIVDSSGKWSGVVMGGPVADGAYGDLQVYEGMHCQVDDLVTSEDTFATVGQNVYYKASTGEWSDTWTVGYYLIGKLYTAKDAAGVIVFEKHRYAEIQVEAGTIVKPGEIGWIYYEVDADRTTPVEIDFGFNFTVLDCFVECRAASGSGTITVSDSTPNAISSAMVCAVDTTIGRTTIIDDAYATVSDGSLQFSANGAADRGMVRLLVEGV